MRKKIVILSLVTTMVVQLLGFSQNVFAEDSNSSTKMTEMVTEATIAESAETTETSLEESIVTEETSFTTENSEFVEGENLPSVTSGFVFEDAEDELFYSTDMTFGALVSGEIKTGETVRYLFEFKNNYTEDVAIIEDFGETALWQFSSGEGPVAGEGYYLTPEDSIPTKFYNLDGSRLHFMDITEGTDGKVIHPGEKFSFYVEFTVPEMADGDYFIFDIVTIVPSTLTENSVKAYKCGYQLSEISDGLRLSASPITELVPGEEMTIKLDVTNRMLDREMEVDIFGLWYNLGDAGQDVTDFTVKSESGEVLSTTEANVVIPATETKTFYITVKLPEEAEQNWTLGIFCAGGEALSGSFGECSIPLDSINSFVSVNIDKVLPGIDLILGEWDGMKDDIFTAEEIASGAEISLKFNANAVDINSVAKDDMAIIQTAAKSKKIGIIMDLTIEKFINGQSTFVTNLNKPVQITIIIPEELRANNRKFSIIRLHNGIAEELIDLDKDQNTVTFATDRFSTYSLVYEDVAVVDNTPKTGDNVLIWPCVAILFVVGGISAQLINKKK